MPITQDRMLALISAAQDFQQAWKRAQYQFNQITARFQAGELTLEEAWNETGLLMSSQLQLDAPIQSNVTIATEVKHFQHAKARNIKTARWQRERRGRGQCSPASPVKPRTVIDPDVGLSEQDLDLDPQDSQDPQDSIDYTPAQSEEDLLARLDPEARARIEAELGLNK